MDMFKKNLQNTTVKKSDYVFQMNQIIRDSRFNNRPLNIVDCTVVDTVDRVSLMKARMDQ